jgi:hypothetical protein
MKKIEVEVPARLLEKAQEVSGVGIAETVRIGLRLVAASGLYEQLRRMRGKVRFPGVGRKSRPVGDALVEQSCANVGLRFLQLGR